MELDNGPLSECNVCVCAREKLAYLRETCIQCELSNRINSCSDGNMFKTIITNQVLKHIIDGNLLFILFAAYYLSYILFNLDFSLFLCLYSIILIYRKVS